MAVQREVERPYITDEEWDKQLRSVITPAARAHAEASKGVNIVRPRCFGRLGSPPDAP